MARIRIAGTDPTTVPTPPVGKSTLFVDINDLSYKAKLPDGSIIPISTTPEFIQDTIGAFFQDSASIDFVYDDSGNIAYFEVIESGLDIFQIPVTPTGNLTSDNVGDALNELQSSIDSTDAILTAHLNGDPSKHDATEIDYERAVLDRIDIQFATTEVETALSDLDDLKLSRTGVQPMLGDLDMDGNDIITGAGLVDGRDVSVDGAKLDTIEFNAKDDQLASEVPLTPYGVLTSTDVQAGIEELAEIISEEQIIVVSKSPGTGQFSSVKDAIDSISDASSAKPYIVKVSPGIYIEDTITMKSFVVLQGQDDGTTIIEVDDTSKTAIIGASNSEIRNIGIRGSTDNGVDLIYFQGTAANGGFSLIDCALGDAYRLIHIEGDGVPTFFRMEGTRIFNSAVFTEGFLVDRTSTGIVQGFFADLIYQKLTGPYPDILFRATGGSRIILDSVTVETAGNTTHGIYLDDGSQLDIITAALVGMDNAVYLPNTGTAPHIQIEQLTLRDNNQDLLIEHIGATGNFSGNADYTKVSVHPSADVALFYSDNAAGGVVSSGSLRIGRRHEILFDGLDLLEGTPGMGIIFGGFLTDNGGFNVGVGSGFGYLVASDYPDHQVKRIDWENTSIALSANQDVYIYFNSSELLTSSASIGNTDDIILIGRVVTNSTGIELIDQSPVLARNAINYLNRALRDGFGPIYDSGSIVTENSTPFKLDISSGTYFYSLNRYTPSGGSAHLFTQYYRDGLGGYNRSNTDTVNNTHYDDGSGTLQSLTAGYYTAHTLYVNCDDADEKYFLVLGQTEYSALAAIESSPLPSAPSWLRDAVTPIARIVVREGSSNIEAVYDIRPVLGFKSSGVSASADHGNLLGLADDDHPQYLLVNGSRAMANDLDMGGNDINNVATVDGVVVSAHASRHLPNNVDALATATAITITDSTNGVGTANAFSRADHVHAHGNRGGGSLHALVTTSVAGFMSAADKLKLDGIENNAKDDQIAAEVPYSNATSSLIATNVQTAIDELDGRLDAIEAQTYVNSFNGRTGAVTAQNGDYTASQITNVPSGTVSAITVQAAINELDSEKVPNTRQVNAGTGLTGGGDLSADRTISMPNVGTPNTYGSATQVPVFTTDAQGRVSAVTNTAINGVPAANIVNTPAGNISATNVQTAIDELDAEKQPLDGDLTALAALATTGIIVRNAANSAVTRAIQAAIGEVTVVNGNGVSGDPVVGLPDVGTAGTIGSASQSVTITTDSKGRVTARTAQAIAITSSQVTDFANAVRNTALTGFAASGDTAILATDTVLQAFNKTQGQMNARVVGPASATDNAVARYDLTTGKLIQNSAVLIDDNGGLSAAAYLRPGTTADTTDGNIRYTNNELQARINGVWRVLGRSPTTITQTGGTSTTSGTYGTIAGMSTTPAAGTYMVIFECSAALGDDTSADIAMFLAGTEQTAYTKTLQIFANGGFGPTGAYEVPVTIIIPELTVNGAQAITAQFRENGGGTLTVGPRSLTVIPVSR